MITQIPGENRENVAPAKPGAPAWFAEWANGVRDQSIAAAGARATVKSSAGDWWWRRLGEDLQGWLLERAGADDAQRYIGAQWGAMPGAVRGMVATEARALARLLQGCPWY